MSRYYPFNLLKYGIVRGNLITKFNDAEGCSPSGSPTQGQDRPETIAVHTRFILILRAAVMMGDRRTKFPFEEAEKTTPRNLRLERIPSCAAIDMDDLTINIPGLGRT